MENTLSPWDCSDDVIVSWCIGDQGPVFVPFDGAGEGWIAVHVALYVLGP